jgi:hypothetical protein
VWEESLKTKRLSILVASAISILVVSQSARGEDIPKELAPEAAPAVLPAPASTTQEPTDETPCHWWQIECRRTRKAEAFPAEAPRIGLVIAVDTWTNQVFLFRDGQLVSKAPAATGSEKYLRKGLREWMFHTPRGQYTVVNKLTNPVWVKPDWAYVEDGEPIPPPNSPKRRIQGHLGKYALDLGEGIMIHGTDDPDSIGRKVSHGCIRVGDRMLHQMYESASVGTPVFIY